MKCINDLLNIFWVFPFDFCHDAFDHNIENNVSFAINGILHMSMYEYIIKIILDIIRVPNGRLLPKKEISQVRDECLAFLHYL